MLGRVAHQQVVDGAAGVHADDVEGQDVGKFQAAPSRQSMAGGHGDHQFVFAIGQQRDFFAVAAVVQDAHIGGILGHGMRHAGADLLLQLDLHLRVRGHEALQLGGQKLGDRRDVGDHSHMAAHACAVVAHLRGDSVQIVEHATRQIEQCKGRGCGFGAAIAAVEQFHLQRVFELGQTAAGGRCGNVLACGGAGDGAFFHHGHEQAQGYGIEFHEAPIIAFVALPCRNAMAASCISVLRALRIGRTSRPSDILN